METNWAAEHLQVIRTLMERSALYRRTLAPLMMVNGVLGIAGAVVGLNVHIQSNRAFSLFWVGVSLVAVIASFLLVRRQALKEEEPFWSPPTRRVSQALLPTFITGLAAGAIFIIAPPSLPEATWLLALVWTLIFGFSLHSAGFFMQRGIKLLGWIFILGGCALGYAILLVPDLQWKTAAAGHIIMGVFFGLVHLAYSVYLYFTEKTRQPA